MSRHNDMQRIADGLTKLEASSDEYDDDQKLAARTLVRREYLFQVAAVNANGSNIVAPNVNPSQRVMLTAGRLLGAKFSPTVAATAANANNAIISLHTLYANGATAITLASANTNTTAQGGTGNLAPGTAVDLTNASNVSNTRFAKGTVLSPTVTMAASGVAMGAGTITAFIELEGTASDYPV